LGLCGSGGCIWDINFSHFNGCKAGIFECLCLEISRKVLVGWLISMFEIAGQSGEEQASGRFSTSLTFPCSELLISGLLFQLVDFNTLSLIDLQCTCVFILLCKSSVVAQVNERFRKEDLAGTGASATPSLFSSPPGKSFVMSIGIRH
jgi:hypothetical protein